MHPATHAAAEPRGIGHRSPERARSREARKIARRSFLRVSAFAGLTLTVGAVVASTLGFVNMRRPPGFGGTTTVPQSAVPRAGDEPSRVSQGKFWLVNLGGNEGDVFDAGGTGGLMAIYWKCTHLGCTVPWRADFEFQGRKGWFRCPCHGSTYTREGGILVAGPAPRPLDVFPIEIQDDLSIVVQTGSAKALQGSTDNPGKAVPYQPGNATDINSA